MYSENLDMAKLKRVTDVTINAAVREKNTLV